VDVRLSDREVFAAVIESGEVCDFEQQSTTVIGTEPGSNRDRPDRRWGRITWIDPHKVAGLQSGDDEQFVVTDGAVDDLGECVGERFGVRQ
jgi:hypothetical protein